MQVGARRFALVRVLSLTLMLGISLDATVIYDENTDGDLSLATSVTLSAGLNTVIGSGGHFSPNIFESDPFQFVVPADTQLDLLEITFSNISYLGPLVVGSNLTLRDYVVQSYLQDSVGNILTLADNCGALGCTLISNGAVVAPSFTAIIASALPLQAGTYRYGMSNGLAFASFTASYDFSVSTVAPTVIPEPMSALLCGPLIGIACLFVKKRK